MSLRKDLTAPQRDDIGVSTDDGMLDFTSRPETPDVSQERLPLPSPPPERIGSTRRLTQLRSRMRQDVTVSGGDGGTTHSSQEAFRPPTRREGSQGAGQTGGVAARRDRSLEG
jgi:hypothetical protein